MFSFFLGCPYNQARQAKTSAHGGQFFEPDQWMIPTPWERHVTAKMGSSKRSEYIYILHNYIPNIHNIIHV
jgi:hypothetical protein